MENRSIMKLPTKEYKLVYPTKEAITKFFNMLRESFKTDPFWAKYRKDGK